MEKARQQTLELLKAKALAMGADPGHLEMEIVDESEFNMVRGFCAVNIEAIMIEYLRQAYKVDKVAIVDTDCHHGDGTQDIYWHDPDRIRQGAGIAGYIEQVGETVM